MSQNPYRGYRYLRENDPVHYESRAGMWFLARHADCSAILRSRDFSAALAQTKRRRDDSMPVSMLNSDPPEHTRLREPAHKVLAPKAVERRSGRIRPLVEECLAGIRGRAEFDFLAEFANPLSMRLLAEMLAVRRSDVGWFSDCVVEASANLDPLAGPGEIERASAAADSLLAYFGGLVDTADDGDNSDLAILGVLARECAAHNLSEEEYLNTLNLLVIGGYEPMANLIGNGLLALVRHPAEMSRLRNHPDLIPRAVEEILRYEPPVLVAARVAQCQVKVGNTGIEDGLPVVALLGAANRDPEVFENPEGFEVGRLHNPHLSFGAGIHFCLGAALARLMMRVSLEAILERFPRMELAGPVEWRSQLVPRGLQTLPVTVG